ncbi:uncharacterized protein isoform X2 [Leptinotarsa decemlineata]|uniref:uncharacterized protein isoform X2 n=1 Tax=Leptinotarsa decemlineata TaxID=7539 RepID=UPI003D30CF84
MKIISNIFLTCLLYINIQDGTIARGCADPNFCSSVIKTGFSSCSTCNKNYCNHQEVSSRISTFIVGYTGISVSTADLRLRQLWMDYFRAPALGKGIKGSALQCYKCNVTRTGTKDCEKELAKTHSVRCSHPSNTCITYVTGSELIRDCATSKFCESLKPIPGIVLCLQCSKKSLCNNDTIPY